MCADRIAWGQTLFCDDLRYEVGNKWTIVGTYHSDLVFNADFPVIVPKICMLVSYIEIADKLTEDLQLKIYMPQDEKAPFLTSDITRPPRSAREPIAVGSDLEPIIHVRMPVVLSPLEFPVEGLIKVRMTCGDVTTKLGTLLVRKATPEEANLFPTASPPPFERSLPGTPAA